MAEPIGRCELDECGEPIPLDAAQTCGGCGGYFCDHHLHVHDGPGSYLCSGCLTAGGEDSDCCDDPDCSCHDDPDWPDGEPLGPPMDVVFASPSYL